MYVDEFHDEHIKVVYISAHTNHDLGPKELSFLPLSKGVKEIVAEKVNDGVPAQRILKGKLPYLL